MLLSFRFFWCGFRTNIEKYYKLIANGREIAPKKHVKKCNILQPAKLSFFWSFGAVFVKSMEKGEETYSNNDKK